MSRFTRSIALALFAALVILAAAPAHAAEKYTRGLRYPSLTPDGKQVVFCYRGDIWVADTDGKSPALRLTIHEAQDTLPRVSPDGKSIVFASTREGGYDLYTMPITGGEAKRISFHSGLEIVCDWSPDGKHILFASNRDPTHFRIDLYEMPSKGGPARRITRDGGRDGMYSPDGKTIVYGRGFNTIYQDNYEGSANYDIYTIPRSGGLPTRLSKSGRNERYPHFSRDGKEIWFVAEAKGVANFYAMPIDGLMKKGSKARQVTMFTGTDVHRPDLSWDGKTMVYERWGQLYTSDLTQKTPKANLIKLVVKGDRRHSGVTRRTVTSGAEQVHLSKDGATMVFALHGDIWRSAGNGGKASRMTSGPFKDEWPRISPDGTTVAFQSDRSGNSDIWLLDMRSGATKQLTKDKSGDFFHNWAPDGRKLVFCSERSGNRDIWTIDADGSNPTRLTKHRAGDDDPSWSPDGRSIAFDSAREGNQSIFVMDADGKNVRRVSSGTAFFQVPSWSPDSSLIVYEAFNQANGGSGGLFVVNAAGGPSMRISRDGSTACWSPRGDYIYFSVGARGRQEIFRIPAPTTVENREKVPFMGSIDVDLRKELGDLFEEAWRILGMGFYDAKMHGVDWKKMKAKYRDMAVDAENKDEFHNIMRQMLAELNASHLGIGGGARPSNAVRARAKPTGYMGLELADGVTKAGGRKVTTIYSKGPADQAGLRVGDVIVQLNGKTLNASTDIDRLLGGTIGQEVRVRFRPFTEDGEGSMRSETVKPISVGQLRAMRYAQWVMGNVGKVGKATKGRIAYIHLSGMNPQNLSKFQRAVSNWNRRSRIKGMIIDVRENGGGNIHQQLMQILTARPFAHVRLRGSPIKIPQPSLYWDKPVVVLINERSFSDAEVFPYIFQSLKVGKVIGVPTPGGVIGTNDITLSDGTTFRIPRTGYFGIDGTNLEGYGVKPDILVEHSAEDRIKGNDRQLAKAIEVVMAEVRSGGKTPAPTKATPTSPTPEKPTPEKPTPTDTAPKPPKEGGASAGRKAGALDPLFDAQAGEWVRYAAQLPGGTEQTILKIRCTGVKDGTVTFEREVEKGPPLPLPLPNATAQEPLLDTLATMGRVVSHETRTATVKGEQVEVVFVTIEAYGGELRMQFSNAVPCLGLMKIELGKTVLMEATEWGVATSAEADEKPAPAPAKPDASAQPATPKAPAKSGPAPKAGKASQGPANPIFDAKVGEWIRLRNVVQGEETVATLRVTEVLDDEVLLDSRVAVGGSEIKGATLRRPRREHMALGGRRGGGKVTLGREILEIKGQKLDCFTIQRTNRRGTTDKRWYCPDVPVTGMVRHERAGQVVKELLDWGTGTPPAVKAATQGN